MKYIMFDFPEDVIKAKDSFVKAYELDGYEAASFSMLIASLMMHGKQMSDAQAGLMFLQFNENLKIIQSQDRPGPEGPRL